jgi:hypothetical protein
MEQHLNNDFAILTALFGEGSGAPETFIAVLNPDKSIRWLVPDANRSSLFLTLYNNSTLKSKIKAWFWLFVLKTRTEALFPNYFKRITLPIVNESVFRLVCQVSDLLEAQYAIFTGTVGPNRKIVIALKTKNNEMVYAKIPLNPQSNTLVLNEYQAISTIRQYLGAEAPNLQIPLIELYNYSTFNFTIQRGTTTAAKARVNDFSNVHAKALWSIYANHTKKVVQNEAIIQLISFWNTRTCRAELAPLKAAIIKLHDLLSKNNSTIVVAYAHADFTPWNMFIDAQKELVYLYDWELAKDETPLLFDAFHFIFQTEIVLNNNDYKQVIQKIDQAQKLHYIQKIINVHSIDYYQYFAIYLYVNTAFYFDVYNKQTELHYQAKNLIEAWTAVIHYVCERHLIPK